MNKNKLKEIDIRNHTCYCFEDITNINDLIVDKILIDKKSYKNILIQNVAYKSPYGVNRSFIVFENVDRCIKNMIALNIYHYFLLMKNMTYFDRMRHLILLKEIFPTFVLINIQKLDLV